MKNIFRLNSFGDIPEKDLSGLKRPYIPVFYLDAQTQEYQEEGMRFSAKIYDGADYTGYHRTARNISELFADIEENLPHMKKFPPGDADDEHIICFFM